MFLIILLIRLGEKISNNYILGAGNIFISSNKEFKFGTTAVSGISICNNPQSFSKTYLVFHPTKKLNLHFSSLCWCM